MTTTRRTALALATALLLAVFGGAVHGTATVRGALEPGTPAAEAAERLQERQDRREHVSLRVGGVRPGDCPFLQDRAS